MDSKRTEGNLPFFAIIVTCALELIFLMVPLWPLTLLAAIIGGNFCMEMKWGAFSGLIGIYFAWFIYFLLNPITKLADQLGSLIIGSSGMGGPILLFIFLIGGVLGLLGGSIGSGIRMIILPSKNQ
ncbi:MAG: hypothetical protein ACFE8U_16990 [Candidatus Hermodarchaeota archaeon]